MLLEIKKIGLQTVVWAEDEDQAMDVAVEKNEWEILDFPVRCIACFPKRPINS